MATLSTVQNYLDRARILLQDTVPDYRFSDDELVGCLNEGLLIARGKRPDLFLSALRSDVTEYSSASPSTVVALDQQYRQALLYFVVGCAQLRDEEGTQDQRAGAFMEKFTSLLLSVGG